MALEKEGRAKTQTLSLRLDPKTRFILEFMSKVKGESITVVVERAIKEAAETTRIGPTHDFRGNETDQLNWTDFWDADEGIRTLNLLAIASYPTDYLEDEIRRFTLDHWEFFYTDSRGTVPNRGSASILWPNIPKYIEAWRQSRTQNYWAVGMQMAEDLKRAGLTPPTWPRLPKPDKKQTNFVRDLDDEVPF